MSRAPFLAQHLTDPAAAAAAQLVAMQLQTDVPQAHGQIDTAATVAKIDPQAVRLKVRQDAAVHAPADQALTRHTTPQHGAKQLATELQLDTARIQQPEAVASGIPAQAVCNSSASAAANASGHVAQQTSVCLLPNAAVPFEMLCELKAAWRPDKRP